MKSEQIKAILREEGVDSVGVASADCVETTPNRRGPRSILTEAKSVVVFGKRMLTGSIESSSDQVVTYQNLTLYQELDRVSYVLGCFFEQKGCRAATIPPYNPVEMSSETKGFVGAVSFVMLPRLRDLGYWGKTISS